MKPVVKPVKKKLVLCAKCSVELSFKEWMKTKWLCCVCERNETDRRYGYVNGELLK